jgi:hypothetical protein
MWPGASAMASMSAIKSPNTLPWPQPVVTTRGAWGGSGTPWRVLTAATPGWPSSPSPIVQSTVMDSISANEVIKRWFSKNPNTSHSGCAPKVISVTSSRLSTYTVKARSAGMAMVLDAPNSLITCTPWVRAALAWVKRGLAAPRPQSKGCI